MKVLVHFVPLEMLNVSLCELCLTGLNGVLSSSHTLSQLSVTQHLDVHTVMMKWSLWTQNRLFSITCSNVHLSFLKLDNSQQESKVLSDADPPPLVVIIIIHLLSVFLHLSENKNVKGTFLVIGANYLC